MTLQDIDAQLSNQLYALNSLILTYEFQSQFEFALSHELDLGWLNQFSYSGIYMIEISADIQLPVKEWLRDFQVDWEYEQFLKKSVPSLKKVRIQAHTTQRDWIPLYLGKSRKISHRLKEHICLGLEKPTFALKLLERKNLHGRNFRISTIKLDVVNYDLIVPYFESALRNSLNPILGRQ